MARGEALCSHGIVPRELHLPYKYLNDSELLGEFVEYSQSEDLEFNFTSRV